MHTHPKVLPISSQLWLTSAVYPCTLPPLLEGYPEWSSGWLLRWRWWELSSPPHRIPLVLCQGQKQAVSMAQAIQIYILQIYKCLILVWWSCWNVHISYKYNTLTTNTVAKHVTQGCFPAFQNSWKRNLPWYIKINPP